MVRFSTLQGVEYVEIIELVESANFLRGDIGRMGKFLLYIEKQAAAKKVACSYRGHCLRWRWTLSIVPAV